MYLAKIQASAKKTRVLITGFLILVAFIGVLAAPARAATTFTVNIPGDTNDAFLADDLCDVNTSSPGDQCTLRAAIRQSNITPGADVVRFAIPDDFGTGVKTINVGATGNGALPAITQTVTINGYTQPGAKANTKAVGDNARIMIELNGSAAGAASGLEIDGASNSVIRGLAINRFSGSGVVIASNSQEGTSALNNRIEGNFIGTDPSGTQDLGNGSRGVVVFNQTSNNNTIGGTTPAARNLISGNETTFGAVDLVLGPSGNKVQGNYIGTDRTGTQDLGNAQEGILIDGENNTVGGTTPGAGNLISGNGKTGVFITPIPSVGNNKVLGNRIGTTANGTGALGNGLSGVGIGGNSRGNSVGDGTAAGSNTIAFNGSDGVAVFSNTTGNRILTNSIFSNAGSAIDLNDDGPTANDPGDADTGGNNLQNKPTITAARASATATTVKGRLNGTPSKTHKVQFFSNAPDTDQGKKFIGQKSVRTDASGNVSFTFKPAAKVTAGQTITATATKTSTGDTSEFSASRKVVPAGGAALAPDTTKLSGPSGVKEETRTATILQPNQASCPSPKSAIKAPREKPASVVLKSEVCVLSRTVTPAPVAPPVKGGDEAGGMRDQARPQKRGALA